LALGELICDCSGSRCAGLFGEETASLVEGFLNGKALPSGDLADEVFCIEGESGCSGDGAAAFEGAMVLVLTPRLSTR